jgi:hypothetical protein
LPYKDYPDWRDFVRQKVPKHSFIDPRNNRQDSPIYFIPQDIQSVISSDGLFHYRSPFGEAIGGACEHGIALGYNELAPLVGKEKIHVIYVDELGLQFPFLDSSAKRSFSGLEFAIKYMNFLETWDKEFEAATKYLAWEQNYYRRLKNGEEVEILI